MCPRADLLSVLCIVEVILRECGQHAVPSGIPPDGQSVPDVRMTVGQDARPRGQDARTPLTPRSTAPPAFPCPKIRMSPNATTQVVDVPALILVAVVSVGSAND